PARSRTSVYAPSPSPVGASRHLLLAPSPKSLPGWGAPFRFSHARPCDLAPCCRGNSGPAATWPNSPAPCCRPPTHASPSPPETRRLRAERHSARRDDVRPPPCVGVARRRPAARARSAPKRRHRPAETDGRTPVRAPPRESPRLAPRRSAPLPPSPPAAQSRTPPDDWADRKCQRSDTREPAPGAEYAPGIAPAPPAPAVAPGAPGAAAPALPRRCAIPPRCPTAPWLTVACPHPCADTNAPRTGIACLCRGLRPRSLPLPPQAASGLGAPALVGSPRPRRDRPSEATG